MYGPKKDWHMAGKKWVGLHGGEFEFSFDSDEVKFESRCRRNVFADTEEEAWGKITEPPKW